MPNLRVLWCVSFAIAASAVSGIAQTPVPSADELAQRAVRAAATAAVETLNRDLISGSSSPTILRFLQGLELEPKMFQSDSAGGPVGTGFHYSFQREARRVPLRATAADKLGLSLSVAGEGNVVLLGDYNPNDFLKGDLAFFAFRSTGGVIAADPESQEARTRILNELAQEAAEYETVAELEASEAWQRTVAQVLPLISDQFYWEAGMSGGVEADQRFSREQWVLGAHFGMDVKAWNSTSTLAQANVFDYPFAAVRWLSGSDVNFTPRGYAWPTFLVSLDLVTPTGEDPRTKAGDSSQFPRFAVESAFKTPVVRQKGEWVNFEADFRYYQEIGASREVRAAKVDGFTWFAATLVTPQGLFASYTTGRLPLDARSDDTFGVGFRFNF